MPLTGTTTENHGADDAGVGDHLSEIIDQEIEMLEGAQIEDELQDLTPTGARQMLANEVGQLLGIQRGGETESQIVEGQLENVASYLFNDMRVRDPADVRETMDLVLRMSDTRSGTGKVVLKSISDYVTGQRNSKAAREKIARHGLTGLGR